MGILLIAIVISQLRRSRMTAEMIPADTGDVSVSTLVQIAVIALLPFAWYIMAPTHSYWHPRLVYRALGISLFAGIIIWTNLVKKACMYTSA